MSSNMITAGLERPIGSLRPYEKNPRRHSAKQIGQIADSIRRFGFTNPVIIDGESRIVAGHGRVWLQRRLASMWCRWCWWKACRKPTAAPMSLPITGWPK